VSDRSLKTKGRTTAAVRTLPHDIYLVYSSDVISTMDAEDKAYACISKIMSDASKFTLRANKTKPTTAITLRAIYKCEEAV
jgi:hypothetical protein